MTDWQPSSRSCFVCGRDNPVGLKLRWINDRDAGEVRGTLTIPEHYNGYPGVAHGGVIGAVLDETAGRTVLLESGPDGLMVTLKLEVIYRRPTPTGVPLTVVARLLRRTERRAEAVAELRLPDGTVTATSRVVLARPPESVAAAWEAERRFFRVDDEEGSEGKE